MLEARRYETAAALAILAIEESGKISLLRELALATDDRDAKDSWKRLRSHTAKNAMWIFPELVARDPRRRRLVLPVAIQSWLPTSLQERLF